METFSDHLITCEICRKTFVFTVEDQRRLSELGQPIEMPVRCPICRQRDAETAKFRGEIKWFDPIKGYGFIRKPDGSEIFFHRSQVRTGDVYELEDGQPVLFDERETPKGPEAIEVEALDM